MANQLTTISLTEELHRQLRIRAIEDGISMAELIRRAVEDYFTKEGREE